MAQTGSVRRALPNMPHEAQTGRSAGTGSISGFLVFLSFKKKKNYFLAVSPVGEVWESIIEVLNLSHF